MEYFKFIDGYPHLLISSKGRVVSVLQDREIKPHISNRGYQRVTLCLNRKLKNYHVHRLVAEAFIPNPNGYDTVDHIDGNKLNNNVENLQWISRADNARKAGSISGRGIKPVICVETGKVYKSINQAAKELNIPIATVSAIAKGEYSSYHNLSFKYYNK